MNKISSKITIILTGLVGVLFALCENIPAAIAIVMILLYDIVNEKNQALIDAQNSYIKTLEECNKSLRGE